MHDVIPIDSRRPHRKSAAAPPLREAADEPIRTHCIQQAEFVLRFTECDEGCVTAARAQLARTPR